MQDEKDKYTSQKKYLSKQKQLRVWVNADKFERFKAAAAQNGESLYSLINDFIDKYLSRTHKQ